MIPDVRRDEAMSQHRGHFSTTPTSLRRRQRRRRQRARPRRSAARSRRFLRVLRSDGYQTASGCRSITYGTSRSRPSTESTNPLGLRREYLGKCSVTALRDGTSCSNSPKREQTTLNAWTHSYAGYGVCKGYTRIAGKGPRRSSATE